MAFDMGFNFRATAGYVTDGPEGVPVLGESYPHTYTNANGYSINGGFGSLASTADRSTGVDVRLAGINYGPGSQNFAVDLLSGSAPGFGSAFTTDAAFGDQAASHDMNPCEILDDAVALITFNGSTSAANKYYDATGVERSPGSGSWDAVRATASVTFTQRYARIKTTTTTNGTIAHFRLTLATAGSAATRSMLMLIGVGA